MLALKTLYKSSDFYYPLWSQGLWNKMRKPFSDIAELLKISVKRIQDFNPDLYNDVVNGKKPLVCISLQRDKNRLAQCFAQASGGLEVSFEPNNIREMLDKLNTKEDKVSFLTYLVAHEMEHARQEQKGNVLCTVKKGNVKRPIIEQEIAMETDATVIGIITAKKAGLTPTAQKMLKNWFRELIPNLEDILDSRKSNEEKEKDLFKEDLKNRTDIWRKKGCVTGIFSPKLQRIVRHPDILVEYNKSHLFTGKSPKSPLD